MPTFYRDYILPSPAHMDEAVANLCLFRVTCTSPDGVEERKKLDDVLQAFTEQSASSESVGIETEKWTRIKLITGQPKKAALGINRLLGTPAKELWTGMGLGISAIQAEFEKYGTEEDTECLNYVLHEAAGSSATRWAHAGNLTMDTDFGPGRTDDGRAGQPFSYFVEHAASKEAELLPEHVLCLRLYTTAAYRSLNNPLRRIAQQESLAGRPWERARAAVAGNLLGQEAHPFPVTVAFIADGIKRLRAVGAGRADENEARDFWRGMSNVEVPEQFMSVGGTEYAPMSTTADLQVALHYSGKSPSRLLFKVAMGSFTEPSI